MGKGRRVEAVELRPAGEREGGRAKLDVRGRVQRSAEPAREVAVAILVAVAVEAVDPRCPLKSDSTRKGRMTGDERARGACRSAAPRRRFHRRRHR